MPTFDEGHQRFAFDDQRWAAVVKYDVHRDYREKIANLPDTKAVDFVGLYNGRDGVLYWFEVKDFRGYRIQNKHRLSEGELATEVGQKVRDSIAGVIGAYRTSGEWDVWHPLVRALWRRKISIRVLFWLEEDNPPAPPRSRRNAAQVQARLLRERLRWLTAHVFVVSHALGGCPDGLTVTDLPVQDNPNGHVLHRPTDHQLALGRSRRATGPTTGRPGSSRGNRADGRQDT